MLVYLDCNFRVSIRLERGPYASNVSLPIRSETSTSYREVAPKPVVKKPTVAPTAQEDADPSTSAPATVTAPSSTATTPTATPTLRTSLDSRTAFRANSGANFRAFELQQLFDNRPTPISQPESPTPAPTTQIELTPAQRAARDIYTRWSNPETLEQDLQARGGKLDGLSDIELQSLAALSIDHPELQTTLREATIATVKDVESLDDVPSSVGFQYLLDRYVLNPYDDDYETEGQTDAEWNYRGLVGDEVEKLLDENLEGARGDSGLEEALEDFTGDLEDLVDEQPAAGQFLETEARSLFEDRGEKFQDIVRADDAWYSDVGHFFQDGVRSAASSLADTIFPSTGPSNRYYSGPGGDFFNNPVVQDLSQFGAGFGMAGHGAIESIGELVADPIGSAKAFVEVVKDPSLLLAGYAQAAEEHGIPGLTGAIGFDFLTASVGAASAPVSISAGTLRNVGRFGGVLDRVGIADRFLPEGLTDEVRGLTGSDRFNDLPTSLQDNILTAIGRNPADTEARGALIGLIDSDGFHELSFDEQDRLVRYVGGDNPYISGPARAQLDNFIEDASFTSLSPSQQADSLRQFTSETSPNYIISPPEGTYHPSVGVDVGRAINIDHPFDSVGPASARRFEVQIEGRPIQVIVPDNLAQGAGNQHSLREIVNSLRSLPPENRDSINRVVLEPGPDPRNGTYGSGAESYMTAGVDGVVRIYPQQQRQNFEALTSSLVHETGHTITHQEWGTPRVERPNGEIRFVYEGAEWDRYRDAAEADGILPSGYSATDIGEDAAEAMKLYTMVRGTPYEAELRTLYPNRFALLDELLGGA